MHQIRDWLPDLKARISSMLMELDTEMSSLGQPITDQPKSTQSALVLALLSKYSSAFVDGTLLLLFLFLFLFLFARVVVIDVCGPGLVCCDVMTWLQRWKARGETV